MSTENSDTVPVYPFSAPGPLEPVTEWSDMRERCPVAHVRLPSGDSAMLLTRYEDVRNALSDPRFTRQLDKSQGAASIASNDGESIFENEDASSLNEGHERWRRLLAKSFTARRVTAMRPRIEAMTEELVDEMVGQEAPVDLMAALGFPLPVKVICDLLGVPDVDWGKLAYWSCTMLNMTQYSQAEIDAAQAEFSEYMGEHIAAKRSSPGDDILSELIRAVDGGHPITERELMLIGRGVLVAGHETTASMIGKMMAMLLSERERWEQLIADPSLIRSAVEELLRFDANAGFGLPRFITEDVEIGGQKLPRGTTVICSTAAANRDERAFAGADSMELQRSPNAHLAFGAGPNACVGQALARTELQIVLQVLLRRLPTLELAIASESLARREGLVIGGLAQLPVRW